MKGNLSVTVLGEFNTGVCKVKLAVKSETREKLRLGAVSGQKYFVTLAIVMDIIVLHF